MGPFIEQAGWGIYPVLIFGFAALMVAVRQLLAPRRGRLLTASWLITLTGMAGLLGTVAAVQQAARQYGASSEPWLLMLGLYESLNALVAACILIVLTMLVMLYAHVRRRTPRPTQRHATSTS